MKISKDTVEYVANLAKLDLSEEEKNRLMLDMERIISFFDKISNLDTSEISPTDHVIPVKNVFLSCLLYSAILQFVANPAFTAYSTTFLLSIGRVPGIPVQIGHIWVLASAPKRVLHEQYIFDCVESSA
jgi:hypothetical protein